MSTDKHYATLADENAPEAFRFEALRALVQHHQRLMVAATLLGPMLTEAIKTADSPSEALAACVNASLSSADALITLADQEAQNVVA